MKFGGMLVFMTLWLFIVYLPMAHMVWGPGGLMGAAGGTIPCLDFAGGTVVHISSGVSALICALYLGKRHGFPHESMKPHNLTLSFVVFYQVCSHKPDAHPSRRTRSTRELARI